MNWVLLMTIITLKGGVSIESVIMNSKNSCNEAKTKFLKMNSIKYETRDALCIMNRENKSIKKPHSKK